MTFKQTSTVNVAGTLFNRPGSKNWWYAVTVPAELSGLPQYIQANGKPVKWAYRKSLGTHDESEAKRRALDVLRQLEERWAIERRQANPIKLSELSPDVLKQMADYIRFCVFSADDYRRDSPQLAHRLAVLRDLAAKKLTKEQAEAALEVPAGAYLDDQSAGALEAWNLARDAQAGKAVARRNHEAILNDAQAAAQWLGVSYDWSKPEARPHLLALLEAKRKALEELMHRDKGHVAPTPQEPKQEPLATSTAQSKGSKAKACKGGPVDILKSPPELVHVRDVLEDWALHGKAGRKPFPVKTVGKYRKAVERFEVLTDNPSMATIDRIAGVNFRRALLALEGDAKMTSITIQHCIMNVGTLLNYYSRETGRLAAGLWQNVAARIDVAKESSRDEWSEEELQQLFGLPVWQRYALPTGKNAGLDAAYWVPLMSLYTGARVTELAQLRVDDFKQEGGVWFLRIEETAEGQSLKAAASKRTIPLSSDLVALGLIDYRDDIKRMGQDWLFPAVKKDAQNNAGGGVGRWFSTLKIEQGFRKDVVFHSLRATVNTALIRAGVDIALRCRYVGQKPDGGVNVDNYNKLKPRDLVPLLDHIRHAYLSLPKVYKSPAWYPGWEGAD